MRKETLKEHNISNSINEIEIENKFDPNKIGLGKIAEQFVYSALRIAFKDPKVSILHNDWKFYTDSVGKGVDFTIIGRNGVIAEIEVKNWRWQSNWHLYGKEIVEREILSRFSNKAKRKILVLSFKYIFTDRALKLLEANNIEIIEVGKLIGRKDFKSKLFYELKAKLKAVLRKKPKKPKNPPARQLLFNTASSVVDVASSVKVASVDVASSNSTSIDKKLDKKLDKTKTIDLNNNKLDLKQQNNQTVGYFLNYT